ncbi:NADPH oxidase organizer 1a [Archocentrus centrarchus]|uniref:NADPH oxidase organizer 1a n=1 Tax=Archocentrus centrarchus TaxID=63155 RepID=UPI0011E9F0D7|nr:putative neutrophil cytosol factor 1C [Archocentrus centrarchus]
MASKRYPINIHLVGVLHKEKSQFYKTSVFWSDDSDGVIYRSFREFKKMHKQLKKAFPPANKLRNSDRIIPRFRDRRIKQRRGRKTPTKSLMHLKFLQKYCDALLRCDQRVCQSKDLIQFLSPRDQDLQPEFAKNGIMVMPSEDERRIEGVDGNGGDVTHPFITETYKCVAPYETTDTKNKPFKVATGDKLDVVVKDKGGWWLVETEDKRIAWFPAPYLQRIDDDDNNGDEEEIDGIPEKGALYTAVKSFKGTKIDEVTVTIDAVVEVLKKSENGWWLVRSTGKVGYIPTMILEPYRYPHTCMPSHQDQGTPPSLLVPSSNLEQQSNLSRSQGNLLQHFPIRSLSPHPIQTDSKQKSRSLGVLPEHLPAQPSANSTSAATNVSSTPTTSSHPPLPTITVEMDGGVKQHSGSLAGDSDDSFTSDSTDFSFSDDLSFSSLNLSPSANDEQLHPSRTPPPGSSNTLSPTGPKGRLVSSVSDPALYNAPTLPKVPPRPRAQEILSRCTSVTRKNAARGNQLR